ncbi:MAG: hypothetical protein ABS99_09080 [Acetobacteraceae bacterium SCN 69-10]|nr:MAG: hypothetical protein ABS99_09080 [Acetobacteraceae bacterium SCN 69-10]
MRVVASGLRFPEGPVWLADGSVALVEIARGTVSVVAPDGTVTSIATGQKGTHMVVVAPGRRFEHTDVARLAMRPLGRAALERYVARDLPVDCAGSYKLERGGIALFERIESDDHTAITGLPLLALAGILAGLGFDAP